MLVTRGIPSVKWLAPLAALLLNLHPLPLQGQGGRHQWRQVHLGVEVTITAYGNRDTAETAAIAAFRTIADLEAILSDWRPDSELRRLSHLPPDTWQPISPVLGSVLALALDFAAASDGAFDPTIGPLTRIWREQRRTGKTADSATVALARQSVDWRAVVLDTAGSRIRLTRPGMQFDLGGIAKGWILDRALGTMRLHDTPIALLEAGGDLLAGDPPPGSAGWRIAVADTVATISNSALAASGPSMQFTVDPDGTTRSHVIDPATGRGLTGKLEVAVRASSGGVADALATTLTLVPRQRWPALLARFGGELVAATGSGR